MPSSTRTVLGLWLAIIGYGLIYAGAMKLGNGNCSLADAFRNNCTPPGTPKKEGTGGAARTVAQQKLERHQQQYSHMARQTPIKQR